MNTTPPRRHRTGRIVTLLAALAPLVFGCGGGGADAADAADSADTLSRRQRDSVVSRLPLPGAGSVGRALEASDRARDRALAHDTIR